MALSKAAIAAAKSRKNKVLSRQEIQDLIAEGKTILIVENAVLNADAWLPFHPGGDKAIRHMVGRDATDEVKAYVEPDTSRILLTS
jgi:sphingolipid 8-(E)-desaturase